MAFGRVSFLSGDRGAAAFQSLQQTSEICDRAGSGEQMHVCPHHPDLQNLGILLCRHPAQELA